MISIGGYKEIVSLSANQGSTMTHFVRQMENISVCEITGTTLWHYSSSKIGCKLILNKYNRLCFCKGKTTKKLSLCLCPILTHDHLGRFTSNFHWELGRTSVPSFLRVLHFRCIIYEGVMTNSWKTNFWQDKLLTRQTPDKTHSWHDKLLTR